MNLDELKKLRENNFLKHKKKKKEYYLKNKATNKSKRKEIDYSKEFNNENFVSKIKEIAKAQKAHIDDRRELIVAKINEYKKRKKEYYSENKEKRLEYDKEYREKKKRGIKTVSKRLLSKK